MKMKDRLMYYTNLLFLYEDYSVSFLKANFAASIDLGLVVDRREDSKCIMVILISQISRIINLH
jgi:hypothetical protein